MVGRPAVSPQAKDVDLRIDSQSSTSGLPPNWIICISKTKCRPYYLDTTTNESRWEPPTGTDVENLNTLLQDREKLDKYLDENRPSKPTKIRCAHLLLKHEGVRRPFARNKVFTTYGLLITHMS